MFAHRCQTESAEQMKGTNLLLDVHYPLSPGDSGDISMVVQVVREAIQAFFREKSADVRREDVRGSNIPRKRYEAPQVAYKKEA